MVQWEERAKGAHGVLWCGRLVAGGWYIYEHHRTDVGAAAHQPGGSSPNPLIYIHTHTRARAHANAQATADYAYGAGGFAAWGIMPNSPLNFEIEVLSAK